MMKNNNTIDNTNWREDYKQYTTNKFHLDLLDNGAKSLSQSWILGALYIKWKKIKNIGEILQIINFYVFWNQLLMLQK